MPIVPDPTKVLGIDVSHWQDDNQTPIGIDFYAMKDKGAEFVIIKAGQNFADPDFTTNWDNAKGIMPRGSYWYYSNFTNPKLQAERWIDALDGDYGEFYLWLDLEDRGNGIYLGWKNWYNLIERLKQLVPLIKIGIYSNLFYWLEMCPKTPVELNYFKQYPLWLASYPDIDRIPKPWTTHLIHQFTDNLDGNLYGVESEELDGNYFNGTLEELHKLTKWKESRLQTTIVTDKEKIYREI